MKKFVLCGVVVCFMLCGAIFAINIFANKQLFSAYFETNIHFFRTIVLCKNDCQKDWRDNVEQFSLEVPKITYYSLRDNRAYNESPLTFTMRNHKIIGFTNNPCENIGKNLLYERIMARFFNDTYKPKKIFTANEADSMRKGELFNFEISTYDWVNEKPLKPSKYTTAQCAIIVFDNKESIKLDLLQSIVALDYGAIPHLQYKFSKTNDIESIKQKMQNAKKYYIEVVLHKEIDFKTTYFKGRWFFGDWSKNAAQPN